MAYRRRQQVQIEEQRLLERYRDLVTVLEQLFQQQAVLLEEQQHLLDTQRTLLQLLLKPKQ